MADSEKSIDKLVIDIKATSNGAEKKVNALAESLERLSKASTLKGFEDIPEKIKNISLSAKTVSVKVDSKSFTAIDKLIKRVNALQSAINKVNNTRIRVDTKDTKTGGRGGKTGGTGGQGDVDTSGTTDVEIGAVEKKVSILRRAFESLKGLPKLFSADVVRSTKEGSAALDEMRHKLFDNTTVWDSVRNAAKNTTENMKDGLAAAAVQCKALGVALQGIIRVVGTVTSVFKTLAGVAGKMAKSMLSGFKSLGSTIVNSVVKAVQGLGSGLKTVGSTVLNYVTKPFTRAIGIIEKWKKKLLNVAFYRAVRTAIKVVTDSFKEGYDNFKAFSDAAGNEFSASMKNLGASALYLKNSLGALAGPLVNSIAPAIDYLIGKFVTLINVINMVLSLLSGRGTYTRAVRGAGAATISMGNAMDKVKVASVSSAKAMNNVGIATMSANNAMNGIALASVETKNAMDGIALASVNANDGIALASAEVKDNLSEVGTAANSSGELGKNLSGAADSAKEIRRYLIGIDELNVIPDQGSGGGGGGGGGAGGIDVGGMFEEVPLPDWAMNIKDAIAEGKWYEAGEMLAGKVNELIDKLEENAPTWGTKIGQSIQHGLEFALGFIRNLKIESLGSSIATIIGNALNEIKPQDLGAILASGIKSIFRFAHGFLQGYTGPEIGSYLAGVVSGWFEELRRDGGWTKAGQDLNSAILSVINGVSSFIQGLSDNGTLEGIEQDLKDFFGQIKWNEIWEALKRLGTIAANAIHWKDMLNVLLGFVANVLVFVRSEILKIPSSEAKKPWQDLETKLSTAESTITWLDVLSGLSALFGDIVEKITDMLPEGGWKSVWDEAKGRLATALTGGETDWDGLKTQFKEKVIDVLNEGLTLVGEAVKESISDAASSVWEKVKETLAEKIMDPIFGPMVDGLNALGFDVGFSWHQGVTSGLEEGTGPAVSAANEFNEQVENALRGQGYENGGNAGRFWGRAKKVTDEIVEETPIATGAADTFASSVTGALDPLYGDLDQDTIVSQVAQLLTDTGMSVEDFSKLVAEMSGNVSDATSSVSSDVTDMTSTVTDENATASDDTNTRWQEIRSYIVDQMAVIKATIEAGWNTVKLKVWSTNNTISSDIKSAWNTIKSTVTSANNSIKSNVTSSWNSIKNTVTTALNTMNTSVQSATNTMKSNLSSAWSSINSSASSGWSTISGTITGAASSIASSVSYSLGSLKNSAYSWGADIASQMASGVNANAWRVTNAASNLASKVKSYLHFSEPDVGPLSDFHTYMPDMLKMMAQGIRDNAGIAVAAATDLAQSISDAFSEAEYAMSFDDFDFDGEYEYSMTGDSSDYSGSGYDEYVDVTIDDSSIRQSNEEVINALYAMGQRIIEAINNKDSNMYLGRQKLTSAVTHGQNQQNRASGRSLSNAYGGA